MNVESITFYHQNSSLEPLESRLFAVSAKVHLILADSYGVLKSGPALILFDSCDVWTGPVNHL